MKCSVFVILVTLTPIFALADQHGGSLPREQSLALVCTKNLGEETVWSECLDLIFEPCADKTPGEEAHTECLVSLRESWRVTSKALEGSVRNVLKPSREIELTDILGQWNKFVVDKCKSVSNSKPEVFRQSAEIGCEITELVGLSSELSTCLSGDSKATYCEWGE